MVQLSKARVLLIDTCGETAGVGLCLGAEVLAQENLARKGASSEILGAIRRLLNQAGWGIDEVNAVGVVNGPGSFTGVRAGMAASKGICEAAGIRMVAVSRLQVLAEAAGMADGFVALDAGRGEVFARDVATGREWLCGTEDLMVTVSGGRLVVAEEDLMERLSGCMPVLRTLQVSDAAGLVLAGLQAGASDVALVEANYGRGESDIYAKTGGRT